MIILVSKIGEIDKHKKHYYWLCNNKNTFILFP